MTVKPEPTSRWRFVTLGALLVVLGFLLGIFSSDHVNSLLANGGVSRFATPLFVPSLDPPTAGRLPDTPPSAFDSSYDLARQLRTYAYVRVPFAGERDLLLSEKRPDVYMLDFIELDQLISQRQGAGWCWLSGKYLQEIYEYHHIPTVFARIR